MRAAREEVLLGPFAMARHTLMLLPSTLAYCRISGRVTSALLCRRVLYVA